MREVAHAARRQPDLLQERADAHAGLLLAGLVVHGDGLGHLVADPLHRVERVHRALEDDRGPGPSDGAQPAGLHRQDVLAFQQQRALDLASSRAAAAGRRRRSWTCRSRIRRPSRRPRPSSTSRFTPRTAGIAAGRRRVGDAQIFQRQDDHSSLPQSRVDDLVQRVPAHRERQDDEHDAHAGATRSTTSARLVVAPAANAFSRIVAPRDAEGVAEAEERQRRSRTGSRSRPPASSLAKITGHDVGQDVVGDHVASRRHRAPGRVPRTAVPGSTAPASARGARCPATT